MNTIFVFTGKKRSGKTTASDLLESLGAKRLSFARPLKDMCEKAFQTEEFSRICPEIKKGDFYKDRTPLHRYILQVVGTDIIRNLDENFWTKKVYTQIMASNENIVIDDARFSNEIDIIDRAAKHSKKYVVKKLHVIRPDRVNSTGDDHESEKLDFIDYTFTPIVNEGTLEEWREKVRRICQKLM